MPGPRPRRRPPAQDADALARALQQRYQTITDFSADFVHTYRGGVLRTQTRERGTVKIKKPGKMRWVYTAPEPKEFVSDGVKIYSHIPQDRQVLVSPVPADGDATTPALFLSGKGDIARDFTAAIVESPVAGAVGLKLTPEEARSAVRLLRGGHLPAGPPDPGARHPRPPGRRLGHLLHEPKGKSGHIR